MSEFNAMVEEINTFLALRGYLPFSDINQFTSEQWFDLSHIALHKHRNIALCNLFKQFGIETSPKIHIVR